MKLSPKALGLFAAVVTVAMWTFFIVIARASAAHNLMPLDIAFLRILGASCVLLPWGIYLRKTQGIGTFGAGSLLGLSPLPLRPTCSAGITQHPASKSKSSHLE